MMLVTVGDLVEDVIVASAQVRAPDDDLVAGRRMVVEIGADSAASVRRRRGGSAANVAVAAARLGGMVRFIGQVGDDAIGQTLVAELVAAGVEPVVRHQGRTGTVVVLCHEAAPGGDAATESGDRHPVGSERTMLTDRGASVDLDEPDPTWLHGVDQLHVPLYSLVAGALATTSRTLIGWAQEREIPLSIDVSATSAIDALGVEVVHDLLAELAPSVVFANEAEAELLGRGGVPESLAAAVFVEKRGSRPARVFAGSGPVEVPAPELGPLDDTTGAGDAFAAGFLLAWSKSRHPFDAVERGHRAAADHLRRLNGPLSST